LGGGGRGAPTVQYIYYTVIFESHGQESFLALTVFEVQYCRTLFFYCLFRLTSSLGEFPMVARESEPCEIARLYEIPRGIDTLFRNMEMRRHAWTNP
jgi:hypothetical protein